MSHIVTARGPRPRGIAPVAPAVTSVIVTALSPKDIDKARQRAKDGDQPKTWNARTQQGSRDDEQFDADTGEWRAKLQQMMTGRPSK